MKVTLSPIIRPQYPYSPILRKKRCHSFHTYKLQIISEANGPNGPMDSGTMICALIQQTIQRINNA